MKKLFDSKDILYWIFDLDGTLLDNEGNVSAFTISKLAELKENGRSIVLCTGRNYNNTKDIVEKLQMDSNDYIICCDGQYIYNHEGKLLFCFDYLNHSDLEYIYGVIKFPVASIYTKNAGYLFVKTLKNYMKYILLRMIGINNMKIVRKFDSISSIEKVCISKMKDIDEKKITDLYNVYCLRNGVVEIHSKRVSKYIALKQAEQMRLINLKNAIYFGDEMNDLECVEGINYSVVPANAPEFLCNAAYDITDANYENGIAKAIGYILSK